MTTDSTGRVVCSHAVSGGGGGGGGGGDGGSNSDGSGEGGNGGGDGDGDGGHHRWTSLTNICKIYTLSGKISPSLAEGSLRRRDQPAPP